MKLPAASQKIYPSLAFCLSKTLDQILNGLVHFNMSLLKEKSAVAEDLFPIMTFSVPVKGDGRFDQKA